MTSNNEVRNIFQVLDSENNGYITIDQFKSAFHDFYKGSTDQNNNDDTLNHLIEQMQPNNEGKIYFDNFQVVFQHLDSGRNSDLKERKNANYSIRRFLSAEVTESSDEDNSDVDQQSTSKGSRSDVLESKTNTLTGPASIHPSNKLQRSRLASSCKNLNTNTSAVSRARILLSAGASPKDSDVHSDVLFHEIGDNFDYLQTQMKRLEEKIESFHSDQNEIDNSESKRLKEDNSLLTGRVNNLEDNLKELEERARIRLNEEKKDIKSRVTRSEEEKKLELESLRSRLYRLESESADLSLEIRQYKDESEKLRAEKHALTEALSESDNKLSALQDDFESLRSHNKIDVDSLKKQRDDYEKMFLELSEKLVPSSPVPNSHHQDVGELSSRQKELENLVDKLETENKNLREQLEEAHRDLYQRGLREGEELRHSYDELQKEMEHLTKEELTDILVKEKDANFKLKDYIEKIIVKVMERHPALLEVSGASR